MTQIFFFFYRGELSRLYKFYYFSSLENLNLKDKVNFPNLNINQAVCQELLRKKKWKLKNPNRTKQGSFILIHGTIKTPKIIYLKQKVKIESRTKPTMVLGFLNYLISLLYFRKTQAWWCVHFTEGPSPSSLYSCILYWVTTIITPLL